MKTNVWTAPVLIAALMTGSAAIAQQNPMDVVPEKRSFDGSIFNETR